MLFVMLVTTFWSAGSEVFPQMCVTIFLGVEKVSFLMSGSSHIIICLLWYHLVYFMHNRFPFANILYTLHDMDVVKQFN